jgi:hypothetical protein
VAKLVATVTFSGLLRGVRWFETDVSGLPVGPIFKSQAVLEASPPSGLLRGVRWFETDVSGLLVGPVFKGQAVASWNMLSNLRD